MLLLFSASPMKLTCAHLAVSVVRKVHTGTSEPVNTPLCNRHNCYSIEQVKHKMPHDALLQVLRLYTCTGPTINKHRHNGGRAQRSGRPSASRVLRCLSGGRLQGAPGIRVAGLQHGQAPQHVGQLLRLEPVPVAQQVQRRRLEQVVRRQVVQLGKAPYRVADVLRPSPSRFSKITPAQSPGLQWLRCQYVRLPRPAFSAQPPTVSILYRL